MLKDLETLKDLKHAKHFENAKDFGIASKVPFFKIRISDRFRNPIEIPIGVKIRSFFEELDEGAVPISS